MSVHLGLKNGRMGLWTAPAGVDASSEGDRMTMNSDLDHLQFHFTGTKFVTGVRIQNSNWQYPEVRFDFPDLGAGVIPICFMNVSGDIGTASRSMFYPPVLHNGASDYDNFTFLPFEIGRNFCRVQANARLWYGQATFSCYVFKNRWL